MAALLHRQRKAFRAELPVTAATREAASAARARGHGGQDMAALIRLLEDIAGVQVRSTGS